MYLVTASEMKEWENSWQRRGVSMSVLMEVAGKGIVDCLFRHYEVTDTARLVFLAGTGNNGGDALVAARWALLEGLNVRVVLVGDPGYGSDLNLLQRNLAKESGIDIISSRSIRDEAAFLRDADIIVEGLSGTGLQGPLRPEAARWVQAANVRRQDYGTQIIAIDVPAGVYGDDGACGDVVLDADLTVVMGWLKRGLCFYPARSYAGTVEILSLGLPANVLEEMPLVFATGKEDFLLPYRSPTAHKGTNGHVGVFAASWGMEGAAILASQAALAAGAGKVTTSVPAQVREVIAGKIPELMVRGYGVSDHWTAATVAEIDVSMYDALVIGCGIGRQVDTTEWVAALLAKVDVPFVLDADGLYALAQFDTVIDLDGNIITPHTGEAARLLNISAAEIEKDRIAYAKQLSDKYHCTAVLKGAPTVVATVSGQVYVNLSGNAGLATAGTGDTLAGIIAALLAQGFTTVDAARFGVYWHGAAGDMALAHSGYGFTASDVADMLKYVRNGMGEV